ncbi:pentapeptide repeat-containing protein [uncultured Hyphomicrobium sp.]|uniref:pentapeptide repeat-containing protein n=1 Tax=uncultured Hyphomicrobium sp. TaxID=194373 RepID=UPI0025D5B9C3|nr:pentapeptide repeat-containing protein [uncultured Hyphomicrobium sp.]
MTNEKKIAKVLEQTRWWIETRYRRTRHVIKKTGRIASTAFNKAITFSRNATVPLVTALYCVAAAPLIYDLLWRAQTTPSSNVTELRDILLSLGALLGTPFVAWRTLVAWKQAETVQQTHLTDLFTKAVEQLGAEKEGIDKSGQPTRKPNTEQRIGAILALERIAHDSAKDYWRVMEVLASYIRNNSQPPTIFTEPTSDAVDLESALAKFREQIPTPPTDIQVAIDVLARRGSRGTAFERKHRLRLDLSGVNLQKIRFSRWYDDETGATNATFTHVDFNCAHLDECELIDANFSNCIFNNASLIGVTAYSAILKNATFYEANLDGANFAGANLKGADIQKAKGRGCDMSEANLRDGGLISCDLSRSNFRNANLAKSGVGGNNFAHADISGVDLSQTHFFGNVLKDASVYDVDFTKLDTRFIEDKLNLENAYGDTTTKTGSLNRPASWPDRELSWQERREKLEI